MTFSSGAPFAALAAVLALAGCALAGCATQPSPGAPEPAASVAATAATAAAPAADPIGLVGLWSVTGAPGQSEKEWIRMDDSELLLFEPCGVYSGGWRALQGRFVTEISGGIGGSCDFEHRLEHWLYDVVGYKESAHDGFDLVDSDDQVVASLTRTTRHAPQSDNYVDEMTTAPAVTDDVRAAFAMPAALPSKAKPVVPEGRWLPVQRTGDTDTFLSFDAPQDAVSNGTWTGSDGCNGNSGRWFFGEDGAFMATAGASTLVGCQGSDAPTWMWNAARVGMVGDELTFYDRTGEKLGSLVKDE